jgi:hypothetical protein
MNPTTKEWSPRMTDEELALFDLKGYILFPAVLGGDELEALKQHCEKYRLDKTSLPPEQQCIPGGPLAALIDHPAIMRVLHSVIDDQTDKIRLETAFLSHRHRDDGHKGWNPHAGGKTVNPNYSYQYHDGRIYAGMTRVVWELNGIEKGKGATAFIPGSHKSNFRKTLTAFDDPSSPLWDTYACPPGSLLVFSEAVRHTSCDWTQEIPRMALFYLYNHINVRHSRPNFTQEMLNSLTPDHRRFFNEVYHPQFDNEHWDKRFQVPTTNIKPEAG